MLRENLNKLIMESMKAHDDTRTGVLRMIKTRFMEWSTARENAGKSLDDATELKLLQKMSKQRLDTATEYNGAGRPELAQKEMDEKAIIDEFLPAEVTPEAVFAEFQKIVAAGTEPIKKNMGVFMKGIKAVLPTADGKMVAGVLNGELK